MRRNFHSKLSFFSADATDIIGSWMMFITWLPFGINIGYVGAIDLLAGYDDSHF